MNLRKILLVLTAVSAFTLSASAQRDSIPLNTILARTSKLFNDHPTEKVYIHTDKPYYAVNDTIWFKAYVTVDLHVPTTLSKIVYVDMADSHNVLSAYQKLQVVNGVASGYIVLDPVIFRRGDYRIRAYTQWMRNADQAYFFNKTISIGSIDDNQVIPHITFKNDITDKLSKVSASVIYKDQNGNPYANKKVSWEAIADDNSIGKGKGQTDQNGVLTIDFQTTKLTSLSTATISTELTTDKKNVTNNFPLETIQPGIDVQFFPEGGTMINGVRTRVAVKAVKPDGLGIDVKGTIVDNTGAAVADFTSQHLGMGYFNIQPENGKTYKANLKFADGSQTTYDLPNAREEGINLSVTNTNPDNLNIRVAANDPYFKKNEGKTIYVVAQSNNIICYAAQTTLKTQAFNADIPKTKFPTGIVQVTIFSATGAPLSERIAFIEHKDQLALSLKSDKASYNIKQKVKMVATAKNKTAPVEGSFSVAVIDETKVPFNEDIETTILTYLLLTSDLKGFIEKPNYYFVHNDDKTAADLDVLMMTQGYRRFSYKNIIAEKYPQLSFLPELGINITGTLRSNTGLPIAKGNIRILIPDKNFSDQTVTDMSGNFKFSNLVFADSTKVTLNARDNANSRNLVVTADPTAPPPPFQSSGAVSEVSIDSTMRPYLENSKKLFESKHTLKEVVIKAAPVVHKQSHKDDSSLTGLNPEADHVIGAQAFENCPNFLTCLPGALMGVTFDNNNFYVTRDYNSGKKVPMQVYVDNMQYDVTGLNNINAAEVESVEIFNNDGLSGINRMTNTNGVLVINMKKKPKGEKISLAQLQDMMPKNNVLEYEPGGYAVNKEFYVPKYDTPAGSAVGSDLRSTVYWNPNVTTDKTGNAAFEFFNSSGRGSFRAVIEGIDKDGNIGRYVYHYKVE